ncbi:MAG TPA: FAD-binding protein [Streptosporangiaceae bacterium]
MAGDGAALEIPALTTAAASGRTNWAGNVTFSAAQIHQPSSLGELQALVAGDRRIRALGTRHSFSDLADSPGSLVSLARLPPVLEVDSAAATARVGAGLRYSGLGASLDRQGWALPNLGSLPHISVAGACATSTHGSGTGNGSLATAVSALELVTVTGDLVTLSRTPHDDRFDGAVVALGRLGVAVSVTLDLVPSFTVAQHVFEWLPLAVLDDHFASVAAGAYSVSLFTDWREPRFQVWFKQRTSQPRPAAPPVSGEAWFAARPADGPRHPIPGLDPASCTEQLGVAGPWYERLPHFRPDAIPSAGDELQTEYLIPAGDAVAALHALDQVRDRIHPVLQVCEVRTVAADRLWLSPAFQRDAVALHFTWTADTRAVMPVVELIEAQLAPFHPRPHWGKIFRLPPADVSGGYPRLADFQRLAGELDPAGKFGNVFTARYLG